ncbi:MAG TPA: sialidase family protein [Acidimicrobiales bacterium]|nr:sialidase family protein [Acidimicrobiales bacterium]
MTNTARPIAASGVERPRSGHLLRVLLGVCLVAIGVGAVVAADALATAPEARIVGGNRPVNAGALDLRDINSHNSPTVVRNPVNGAQLAMANRIDTPFFSCALHLSHNGGSTWFQTPIPIPGGEEPKCYAPEPAFGADGVLYLSYVTLQGQGNVPNAGWIVSSKDGGRTLSQPVRALGRLSFQVRLVADPQVPARIYLASLQAADTATLAFPDAGYPINIVRSDDGGSTWGAPVRVSAPDRERVVAPSLAIGPNGLYLSYLDLGADRLDYHGGHDGLGGDPYDGTWSLVVARSNDGGHRWEESVVDRRIVPSERFIVFIPPYPSIAVDAGGRRVYASFNDSAKGDSDVWVWASKDSGLTGGGRVRVNDTPVADGTSQYRPKLAVSPEGRLDVVYYDRRKDADNVMNEVSFQSSFDGGKSFAPSLRVSDRPFDSTIGFGSERNMPDLGSRLGLVSSRNRALTVWSDTRSGTVASNKQDLVQAVVDVTPPGGLSNTTRTAVKAAAVAVGILGVALVLLSLLGTKKKDLAF